MVLMVSIDTPAIPWNWRELIGDKYLTMDSMIIELATDVMSVVDISSGVMQSPP